MNGEAADEVVRIMLNGTEVALRLTGSAAKNLGVILYEWAKNNPKVTGKTSMMKLLRSGEELQVVTLTREQYDQFKALAKKQVLFAPFVNKEKNDGMVEVVISSRSLAIVNHILEDIGYGKRTQAEVEPSKKENTPSKQSSSDSKDKPQARQSDRNSPTEDRNSNGKPSVLAQLEANRKFLEERERKEQEHGLLVPRRRKTKDKDNAR